MQRLEIVAGEHRVPMDLSRLGYVVLELRLPGGRSYRGPAKVTLLDGKGRMVRRDSFEGGPYRLAVLETERAEALRLDFPAVGTAEPDGRIPLRVDPQRSSTVWLNLLDTP